MPYIMVLIHAIRRMERKGLDWEEAALLKSYQVYQSMRQDPDPLSSNVFTPLTECSERFKIRQHGLNTMAIVNDNWPGQVFYHIPGAAEYANMYIGNGLFNHALPVMVQ